MADENSFTSWLEDSFSDGDGNVQDYSSKIKDALEALCQRYDTESLQRALQESLSSCPDSLLEEQFFREALALAHRLLLEAFEQLKDTIKSSGERISAEDVKRQILVCHELLNVWEKSTERVSKLQRTPAIGIKSLIENVPVTVKFVFEHCKESTKSYGSFFEDVSEKITNLFRKANRILHIFLTTLQGVIVFNTDTESETELLVKVIDGIGSIASVAYNLDLMTFAETSKVFTKLALAYQQDVKRANPASVISHLAQILRHATAMLLLLHESHDIIEDRKIRVIGLTLKILDRLCIAYCSCLNKDTLFPVIELLLQMHRCFPSCFEKETVNERVLELINAHISRGCEPFLNTAFKTSDFKQAYFDYGYGENVDKMRYHLLTISIMKKLCNMPYEQHCKWTLGADSIIDVALTNINNLQEEVCTGEIKLPGIHDIGERPRYATLYEATLLPICGLISQIPAEGFHAGELLLLKHLLSNRLWSSLLSSDIWCFIGRIGSSELCVSHVKYLLKVHATLMNRHNSLQTVILENLIGRLYSLLSEEARHSLVTELDDLENPSWIPVSRFLPSKTKSFLQNRLARVLKEIPSAFAELQRQPTLQTWNRSATLMLIIGKLNYVGDKEIVDVLAQIWNSIANTIEVLEDRQLDILSGFMLNLFSATQPDTMQDDTFSTILEAVLTSHLCFSSHMKVIATHYLRNSIGSFGSCGVRTANALAELNCRLLEDENPWVRQEALESFDHVAHMCPNEDLVARMTAMVTRKPVLSDSLPAYFLGTSYYKLRDFPDVRLYVEHVTKNSRNDGHVCYHYEESQPDEKCARLETQTSDTSIDASSANDLDELVNKICDELNDVLKKNKDIGDHSLRRLRLVCAKILNLTESSK